MKPMTWGEVGGTNGKWREHKNDNYDGLIEVGCVTNELIPKVIRFSCDVTDVFPILNSDTFLPVLISTSLREFSTAARSLSVASLKLIV
jgi:hypothetical protein